MESVGDRLRAERKQMNLSQRAFGERGGVTEKTQVLYEKGERAPDANYLSRISGVGVDVLYVLTGRRDTSTLTALEADLVRRFREAPDAVRVAALAALAAGAAPAKYQQDFKGANIGQQVSGDVTGSFSINMGSGRKNRRNAQS
ncbi:helix-turn-helix domain-containing protein [Paraburkholderia sp. EG304]|uniref:helix-turn-helix domain-containing protein n=1 Tax=Paraburkholderia sp. EG304 TaxID=3237015 RepID=UPI00397D2D77